jgi:hypothetical protein
MSIASACLSLLHTFSLCSLSILPGTGQTVIELISHTTTKQGLTVTAVKDSNSYPTGIKVSDEDLATLNIKREPFHGDWNYTIQPQ